GRLESRPYIFVMRIPVALPFHWTALLDFLRPRSVVETVGPDFYQRGDVVVRFDGEALITTGEADRVRQLFDADADSVAIDAHLARFPLLNVANNRGVRVPGAWDPFELALRAIVGQQVSVAGATTLMKRIATRHGLEPETVAKAENVGMPNARWETIRGLARAVACGDLVLARGATLDETIKALTSIKGVGPWTAHYIAMRALREPDAFPQGDLGLRKAAGNVTDRELLRLAEPWRPWRAYAAMLLWRSL
ncbi:MAG TPA: AlkA N-terminal domain-containing protein, partial [Thermoanaerobaculia bacterium]|nr:AlkA N-terminal domain-containing protein [Thermoanaerobaculia bacterium]